MCTVYITIDKGIPLPGDTQRNLTPELRQFCNFQKLCSIAARIAALFLKTQLATYKKPIKHER